MLGAELILFGGKNKLIWWKKLLFLLFVKFQKNFPSCYSTSAASSIFSPEIQLPSHVPL